MDQSQPYIPRAARTSDPEAVKKYLDERLEQLLPASTLPRYKIDDTTYRIRECPSAKFCEKPSGYANRLEGDNQCRNQVSSSILRDFIFIDRLCRRSKL